MLSRLIEGSIRQRVVVWALSVLLCAAGLRAFVALPIEAFPDVQDVQVQVVTQYPGQAPAEVERAVTLPIEREMGGIPRMTQLRSVSITGLSVVTMTFSDGTDDYFARQRVLERLQQIVLPAGVVPALAPLTTAVGEIYRYVIDAPADMTPLQVRELQDWVVRPALRMTPGVADIVSFGGAVREYQVAVDPARMARYQVTIEQLRRGLSESGANVGGGVVVRGSEVQVLRAIGAFTSTRQISAVIVAAHEGRTVTVGDVADVSVAGRPRSGSVSYNERDEVVEGIVQMTKGGNAAVVVDDLRDRVEALNRGGRLPHGVSIRKIYDRTELIAHTVHTVGENLLLGALLVTAILVVFLRDWMAALIVAAVIPLALLSAFIALDARGVSANLISLGAVDFGIIVDSAVVMIESVMVRLAIDATRASRAARAAGAAPVDPGGAGAVNARTRTLRQVAAELGRPILFSKAIIILAFLPIFTFQRVEGRIFAPVAFTLAAALVAATVLTLTLVPALTASLLRRRAIVETDLAWLGRLRAGHRRMLVALVKRPAPLHASGVLLVLAAAAAAPLLGSEFLPKLDEGNIWLTVSLPPSTSLEQSQQVERVLRNTLLDYQEVKSVIGQVGRPDDGTDPKGLNNIEILADLKPHGSWRFGSKEALVADMSARLRAIPGLPTNFSQVIQDNVEEAMSGVKGEIAVKIYGPDLEVLQQKAQQVERILRETRGGTDVAAIRVGGQAEIVVTPDALRLARHGLTSGDIDAAVAAAFGGVAVNAVFEGDRRFDVVMRFGQQARGSIDDLSRLAIALPAGGTLPLGELATVELREGASRIAREAGGRSVSVKANLRGRDQGSYVAEARARVGREVVLPDGYRITWGGQFENQQRALARLAVIVPTSLALIFALLFWAFGSARQAMLVLAMVPFTLIGGIAGLALSGLTLSVSAAVGFIAVAGICVQNSLIMVEKFVENLREGMTLRAAVVAGAAERLRPVLMTALMAGLGLLPAALSHGIGSETQRPFAVVIVGGIVTATFFTLTMLPVLFARFGIPEDRRRARAGRVREDAETPDALSSAGPDREAARPGAGS